MKHFWSFLWLSLAIWGCVAVSPSISSPVVVPSFTPSPTLLPPSFTPSPSPAPLCTPPACRADEAYFCSGDCPGGCGTICATVTPDSTLRPLQTIETNQGWWIGDEREGLLYLGIFDPSGRREGVMLRPPVMAFSRVLAVQDRLYILDNAGDALTLRALYPQERFLGTVATGPNLIALSTDGKSLVWSRDLPEAGAAQVFLTSLENGDTQTLVSLPLPENAAGHSLKPLFYNAESGKLLYAFHAFYSGMSPTQVASLYLFDFSTGQSIPLVPLQQVLYAGFSAAVDAQGERLAYLTYGEPNADFSLPWTVHLRSLTNGEEMLLPIPIPAENVEVHFFSPDGEKLLLTSSRHMEDGSYRSLLLLLDIRSGTFHTQLEMGDAFFEPLGWSPDGWVVLTNTEDDSTWAMRPMEGAPVKITPFRFLGFAETEP
ncbi:MAG: hypothetical protein WHS87_00845 [Anaerolineales bacterium]